jgi:hypothetical protein
LERSSPGAAIVQLHKPQDWEFPPAPAGPMDNSKTNLHERRLMHLFMVLNVSLAAAFVVYLVISRHSQPPAIPASFPAPADSRKNLPAPAMSAASTNPLPAAATPSASAPAATHPTASSAASATAPSPAGGTRASTRTFTWQDLETPDYRRYIQDLRAIGCPEEKVRQIVREDITQLFDQRRLQVAITSDLPWWRPQPEYLFSNPLRERGRLLEEQRRSLTASLLGPDAPDGDMEQAAPWLSVPLTGAVLGAMPMEKHVLVQEICARALERQQGLEIAPFAAGQPASPVEAARSRNQTRADLRQVMDANELDEFLLRYSQIARNLRSELAGANPTEAEFRKVFRALDPLEHQMQQEFGGVETMSQQQRERYLRHREAALKEALGPARYEACLVSRDPLYAVAQALAQERNAPPEALMPIYQLAKATEARLQKIRSDASLSPEEKARAISAVNREQTESIQKILRDPK